MSPNHKSNDESILSEISSLKQQIGDISQKVDLMLEILNNFSLMLVEDEDDLTENYNIEDSDESWVPKEDWEDDEELDG